jgi:hypothetical protein
MSSCVLELYDMFGRVLTSLAVDNSYSCHHAMPFIVLQPMFEVSFAMFLEIDGHVLVPPYTGTVVCL